jgi:hypothetical protein
MIASPGSSIAPPPPGYTTAGGPTAAPSCLNACGTEAGGQTATPGGPTARPFAASSSCASSAFAAPDATTMTPPRPPVALASQYNSRRPRAARESLSPPLLQQSPPVKAVPVAPSVNRHLMTMWVKRGFRLPIDKLTLLATSSSPLSLVPTSVRAALADPSRRRAIEEEYDASIINNT